MNQQIELVRGQLRTMWIYRWWALVLASIICVAGFGYVAYMPSTYKVSAKIFIDTRSMLTPLLRGLTVSNNMITNTASLMRRTLLTRPNLEEVARRADLDLETSTSREFEVLVTQLGDDIKVSGTTSDNIYEISYSNQKATSAKRVVDELLNTFLETALGETRKDNVATQKFLDEQIAEYERRLLEAEERLKEFKQRNAGMMPGDNIDYFGRLAAAQGALAEAELQLREVQQRRETLARQVAGEEPVFGFAADSYAVQSPALQQIEARLATLQQQLDASLLQFTDKHPDVVALRGTISALEGQKAEEMARLTDSAPQGPAPINANPVYQQMKVSLSNAEAQVAALSTRVAEYNKRVTELQRLADTVPEVEADLARLNRDYGLHKKNYQELLERREAARMSQEVERTGDDIKLRVIEPPRVPLLPTGPNRLLLFSGVLGVSLGVALAFAFLLAQLKPRFFTVHELKESLAIPVLGSVSLVANAQYKRQRRLDVTVFAGGLGVVMAAYLFVIFIGLRKPGVYERFHQIVSQML